MVENSSRRPHGRAFWSVLALCAILIGIGISVDLFAEGPQTEPDLHVTVTGFTPQGDTPQKTNITITFSRDMVSENDLNKVINDPPIQFSPRLAGIARWIDKNVLRFYPDHSLAPATTYNAAIASARTFAYGNRIDETRTFSYSTPPLSVGNIYWDPLFDPFEPGKVRLKISISFSYDVDLDQLPRLINIKGGRDATAKRLNFRIEDYESNLSGAPGDSVKVWFAHTVSVVTESFEMSDKRQEYLLEIKDGLACYHCGEGLRKDYSTAMRVEARRRQFIRNASANVEGQFGSIYIACNSPVDAGDAEDYIRVIPEIPFTIEQRWNRLILRGKFVPGETYTIEVGEGLPTTDGSFLERNFSSRVVIPDIPPTVSFTSHGIYLPKQGNRFLELETTNIPKLSIEFEQVFANNLVYALGSEYTREGITYSPELDRLGRNILTKTVNLAGEKNAPLLTTIDAGGFIGDTLHGLFRIAVRNYEGRWSYDSRLVLITDLGISARLADDYLMVWVNTLSEAEPVKKATVTLYSKNNQVLVSGKTDSRGIAVFDNIGDRLEGFEPQVITIESDNDLAFLKFEDCRLPLSEFDVKGRPYLSRGYEAYVYSDRGIYRPGDTAHIVSIVRGPDGALPEEFPYFIRIFDPSGREFSVYRVQTGGQSMLSVDVPLPDFAPTGKYRADARIGEDYIIGRDVIQVEDFIPDKIKVTAATDEASYKTGDNMTISATGMFLFGAPARDHTAKGHISIEPQSFSAPGYTAYSFDNNKRQFTRLETDLTDQKLDDNGSCRFTYTIPSSLKPPSALKGLVSAGVSEQGGRAVYAYTEAFIHPYPVYLGLNLGFEGYAKPGVPCDATVIALTPEGKATEQANVKVQFVKLAYNSVLKKNSRGRYRYVSEETEIVLDSTVVDITPGGAAVQFTPPGYGRYKIVATDPSGGHSSAVSFYASGWGYAPWSMEQPDRIELDLDKDVYSQGEEARVQIRAPFGGKLLLTVEKDKVYDFITYDMDDNTAEISLPIAKDYFPNAYITATIIKKSGDVDKTTPARAFGMIPVKLTTDDRTIPVNITAPENMKPNSKLTLTLNTGRRDVCQLAVAAVDAGILQVVDYQAPNPIDFFYGQRQPHLNPFDIYSFIYPNIMQAASHLSPGGGLNLFASSRKKHLNPITARRVKPMALWSGIITTKPDGTATIPFDVGEFNGQLVVMASVVNDDAFGATSTDIIVRDNIILQESFPRFVAPGDSASGTLTIFNNTGHAATIDVMLDASGPVDIAAPTTQTITLDNETEGRAVFTFMPRLTTGKIEFTATARSGSNVSTIHFELPNRPVSPPETRFGFGTITADAPVDITLPDDMIASTADGVLRFSSLAGVQFAKNINYLASYPYGCLEQTTSRLFPLLYFDDLARFIQPEVMGSGGPEYFIQEGILKISSLIRPDGWFSFWQGSDYYNGWASVYASHFLLEAKRAGYHYDKHLYNDVLDDLKKIAQGKKRDNALSGEVEQVYAAYALARVGIIEKRITNAVKEIYAGDLPTYSRYQLAGVLYLAGDAIGAKALLPDTVLPDIFEPETGGRFSSGVRTNAILLQVLNMIDPANPSCAVLAKSLTDDARIGHWYTTQATAWALMALGEYLKGQAVPDYTLHVDMSDGTSHTFGTADTLIKPPEPLGQRVSMSLDGTGVAFYYWSLSGVPTSPAPAEYSRGIRITREYLTVDGTVVNPTTIEAGTQLICHIQTLATEMHLQHVVINDMLPSCLEIENPRLKTTPRLSWLPASSLLPTYQDIRDDRLLLFTNLGSGKAVDYYYSVRVTSTGRFVVPPIMAECMYNPIVAGASSSGIMVIQGTE